MSVAWTERKISPPAVAAPHREARVRYTESREAIAEEIGRHPSLIARIVALSNLWDSEAGIYRHPLAAQFGTEEVDASVRRLHQEVLVNWLSLPLKQQKADVGIYLNTIGVKPEWFNFRKMGLSCLPVMASVPER